MECAKKVYTSGFCTTINSIDKLHDKLDNLRVNRKFRLRELKDMPEKRSEIKQKAKVLYLRSTIYRLEGRNRLYRSYMNQGSVVIKRLNAISRYRKRKEIHGLNRSIREVKAKISDLENRQITRGDQIKEYLFQDFLKCCS